MVSSSGSLNISLYLCEVNRAVSLLRQLQLASDLASDSSTCECLPGSTQVHQCTHGIASAAECFCATRQHLMLRRAFLTAFCSPMACQETRTPCHFVASFSHSHQTTDGYHVQSTTPEKLKLEMHSHVCKDKA